MSDYVISDRYWSDYTVTWAYSGDMAYYDEVKAAFDAWDDEIELDFTEVSYGSGADIVVYFDYIDGDFSTLGETNSTYYGSTGVMVDAEIVIDSAEDWTWSGGEHRLSTGTSFYEVMAHEIGHAIGLGHPSNPDTLMYAYADGTADDLTYWDIYAAQAIYGAETDSGGSWSYGWYLDQGNGWWAEWSYGGHFDWYYGWYASSDYGWYYSWYFGWHAEWNYGWSLDWAYGNHYDWYYGWNYGWQLGWNYGWNYGWYMEQGLGWHWVYKQDWFYTYFSNILVDETLWGWRQYYGWGWAQEYGWHTSWNAGWYTGWDYGWYAGWKYGWWNSLDYGWYQYWHYGWSYGWDYGWWLNQGYGWHNDWNYGWYNVWDYGWDATWNYGWHSNWVYGWHLT
ncbi:matrixin family metalloprotease [Aliiruegeria sabulilitoris]|uniref:matrixin family metalloprotease n=1 Tax=Aliiruegeria sabulilitoris TaxID=1510458 RepID=UPI0008366B2B|nr:matrixin family metalloprotease [Aliiruegeria sabulilitoris]NDR57744.1 matrixin family metalloprotease [Pseudoruegeria sp. M32A2M]